MSMSVAEIFVHPSGGPELYVFDTWDDARNMGFNHDGSHPLNSDARAIFANRVRVTQLAMRTVKRVVVASGVNLERDIDGEGTLRQLLKKRQMTWGSEAEWVVL